MQAQRRRLPGPPPVDGPADTADAALRWHFQHGPIDLVIGAEGEASVVAQAHEAAWARFQPLLGRLVAELPRLRQPLPPDHAATWAEAFNDAVARQMARACAPLARGVAGWPGVFITPMAAVAGAVAQAVIGAYQRTGIARAWVNNGGDIALHLAPGQQLAVGLVSDLAAFQGEAARRLVAGQAAPDGRWVLQHADPVRGIATSGWRGRSFSLGVADSVTVLAASAPQADAAATVVANAVDLPGHPGVRRAPARTLRDDSDLGDLPVTVAVPAFTETERGHALQSGLRCARALQGAGLLHAAVLVCQGSCAVLPAAATLQSQPA